VAAVGAVLMLFGPTATVSADLVSVDIVDAPRPQPKWGFAPGTRRVPTGSWVTWSNGGQDAHTVTALDGTFDSGNLDPSEGFSMFFADAGTFAYVCALHPWMTGKIIVGNGIAINSVQPPVPEAPQADDAP
jgi:plastocyanin